MKCHRSKGSSIVIKTKEGLARELDRLLDTDIHSIAGKNRWVLDMDPSDRVVMSMQETQYVIFELQPAQAQDKAVKERTDGKMIDFIKYCNIPGMCVPTRKVFERKGCIEEERSRHKKTRNRSSHVETCSNKIGKEQVTRNKRGTQTTKEGNR